MAVSRLSEKKLVVLSKGGMYDAQQPQEKCLQQPGDSCDTSHKDFNAPEIWADATGSPSLLHAEKPPLWLRQRGGWNRGVGLLW